MASKADKLEDLRNKAYETGELPQEGDPDVGNTVLALWEYAQQAIKPWYDNSDKCRKYYKGDQLDFTRIPKKSAKIVDNQILVSVENLKPKIVDGIAETALLPTRRDDVEMVESLDQRVNYAWRKSNIKEDLPDAVHDLIVDGGLFYKVFSDGTASRIDNRRILRDPDSSDFDSCFFIMDQILSSEAETKRAFRKAKNIKASFSTLEGKENEPIGAPSMVSSETGLINFQPYSETDTISTVQIPVYTTLKPKDKMKKVLRLELWIRDCTKSDDYKDKDEDELYDNDDEYYKYPCGRVINVSVGIDKDNNISRTSEDGYDVEVLLDRKNPFERLYNGTKTRNRAGRFPFVAIQCYPVGDIWSNSIVSNLISLQDGLNFAWRKLMDNTRLVIGPKTFILGRVNLGKNDLTNDPDEVVIIDPKVEIADIRSAVMTLAPPSIVHQLYPVITGLRDAIKEVSSSVDVQRGQSPTGISAGIALDILRQESMGTSMLKAERITRGHKLLRENIAYIVQEIDEEPFEFSDDSVRYKNNFIDYNPHETRDVEFEVKGTRRKDISQKLTILAAIADLESKGIPGEIVLKDEEDPELYKYYVEKMQERVEAQKQMQFERDKTKFAADVGLEVAKSKFNNNNNNNQAR